MYCEKFAHTPPVAAGIVSQQAPVVGAGSSTVAAAVQNIAAFILAKAEPVAWNNQKIAAGSVA